MNLFGLSITRASKRKSAVGWTTLDSLRTPFRFIGEAFTGAWQRNIETSVEDVLCFAAVYACVTLKATDISKLRIKEMQQDDNGIWSEVFGDARSQFAPILRKQNHYQTRIQFVEQWMTSKFINGNTYVLKKRNNRGGEGNGNVEALYVLAPDLVKTLVTPSGDVYYSLTPDKLSRQTEAVVVPASEIIHDRMTPLYHPLCGVSPISACALAASQGLKAQRNAESFLGNGSMPSGIVTLPDEVDEDQAKDYQRKWTENFTGNNVGRIAVLGLGTKFEPLTMKAVDAQLIEQLKWTAENCCTAHHVPPFKVGVGPMPTNNNGEILNQQYYSEALQANIEQLELLLDEGLGMPKDRGTELDLDGLFRADTVNRTAAAERASKSGMTINEVRRRFYDLGPKTGGDSPLIQQQNYSIEALAKRDASEDPFGTNTPPPAPATPEPKPAADAGKSLDLIEKGFLSGLKEAA